MRNALDIKAIAIHCTAGYSHVPAIEDFWKRPKDQGGAGWKYSKGYHVIIDRVGAKWYLKNSRANRGYTLNIEECDWGAITNGIRGFNELLINIAYIGGVNIDNYKIAEDSRTPEQKTALIEVCYEALEWLRSKGNDINKIDIWGHRDFSFDNNKNGVIDSYERIKECPSFDAMEGLGWITNTKKLPVPKKVK